ncbi:MAG: Hsp20/alpha crystallin family protein [Clostridia bacterium]|nr:Hsp20/alpha crystallin family protein [Clostridia bacterium]
MFDLIPFGNRFFATYDPFKEFEAMERRLFAPAMPAMKTDIRETDSEYILETDLPGFSKEEIHAEIRDGVLTLRAEHKKESDDKDENGKYLRRERSYASYARRFSLDGIQADKITAAFRDGVLTLTLPKEAPKQVDEGRKLEIQ